MKRAAEYEGRRAAAESELAAVTALPVPYRELDEPGTPVLAAELEAG